jgi:hypothetical protein
MDKKGGKRKAIVFLFEENRMHDRMSYVFWKSRPSEIK